MQHSLNYKIFSFLNIEVIVLELLEGGKDVLLYKEFDEDVLKPYLLYRILEVGVGEDNIIAITIDEQNGLVFDFCVSSSNAGRFQKLFFATV